MKKSKIIIIVAAGVLLLAGIITALLLIFKDNYKPDKDTLSIVNEVSVNVFGSQITDEYELTETQKRDDGSKLYVFEFKLENGETATFAFGKDLKETKKIYWKDGESFKMFMFVDSDSENRDNDVSWPKGWK